MSLYSALIAEIKSATTLDQCDEVEQYIIDRMDRCGASPDLYDALDAVRDRADDIDNTLCRYCGCSCDESLVCEDCES